MESNRRETMREIGSPHIYIHLCIVLTVALDGLFFSRPIEWQLLMRGANHPSNRSEWLVRPSEVIAAVSIIFVCIEILLSFRLLVSSGLIVGGYSTIHRLRKASHVLALHRAEAYILPRCITSQHETQPFTDNLTAIQSCSCLTPNPAT